MVELRIVEREDPEAVFSLLSDDTRVALLQALWRADEPMGFSELRETVGIRDSGQFNYHLNKLTELFVRKTPEGYTLTQAGKVINGAIEAGSYTLEATFDPIDLESACPYCDGSRTLEYEDEVVHIECDSCEISYHFVVPPGVFAGYDLDAIPSVANRYLQVTVNQIRAGFCWFCEGRTRPTVDVVAPPARTTPDDADGDEATASGDSGQSGTGATDPTDDADEEAEETPILRYDCERCGHTATMGLWVAAMDHPAVRRLYERHDIDIRDHAIWEFPALDPDHLTVRERDPIRASVTYEVGGETLTIVLDENADVVEVAS